MKRPQKSAEPKKPIYFTTAGNAYYEDGIGYHPYASPAYPPSHMSPIGGASSGYYNQWPTSCSVSMKNSPPHTPITASMDSPYKLFPNNGLNAFSFGAPANGMGSMGSMGSMGMGQNISLYGGATYLPSPGMGSLATSTYPSVASYGLVDAKAM